MHRNRVVVISNLYGVESYQLWMPAATCGAKTTRAVKQSPYAANAEMLLQARKAKPRALVRNGRCARGVLMTRKRQLSSLTI